MASQAPPPVIVDDLTGGRNGTDPPFTLPANQCTEALNIDWKDTRFARKRGGSIAQATTGGTAFSSGIQTIERHVPGALETVAELWAIDGAATPIWKRFQGSSFADITVDDAVATVPSQVVGVALNGKRFFAYDSSVDRMHVWDPSLSSPRVRRMGFATPGAPTAANQTAGPPNVAAVLRYYRVRWLQISGSIIVRRSEPGASVSFTPNGTSQFVRITRPTAASEGETHWEVEVSEDDVSWYLLAGHGVGVAGTNQEIAIATTTYDENEVAADYIDGDVSDVVGTYARFPSVKFLMTDGNRLLGGESWEAAGAESSGKHSRIWFTPVLGSADTGDDERMMNTATQKNWVDLNENDGGAITGMGGPLNGLPWIFKYRQVWKLQPTGDVQTPYLPRKVTDHIGCIAHKTITLGEDAYGRPALYFLSHRGPYRITHDGEIQYLGRDNEDIWRTMNLAATSVTAHSVYYPQAHQWWVWIATTASNNDPETKMMFDVQLGVPDAIGQIRGGWAKHTGDSAGARCSCLFSDSVGASMGRALKPYIGRSSGTTILKCDTTDTDDNGTDFMAGVVTRPLLATGDLAFKVGMREPILWAKALAGSDIVMSVLVNFTTAGARTAQISLAPVGVETAVIKKIEGLEIGEADVIQIYVGDGTANDEVWTVYALLAPVVPQEER